MAFYNYVIYAKSDFSSFDYNVGATTNASITAIYVTISDDDASFSQQGGDGPTFQTISSSSVPGLVGQNIFFDVTGPGTQLWDTSAGTLMIGEIRIGGSTNYIVATQDGVNTALSPSTTYNEDLPVNANLGLDYATSAMPCFTSGTRIRTPNGDVAIEALSVGDKVSTIDHGAQRIQWIGTRPESTASLNRNPNLRPIRIAKGAMGNGLPHRDLLVSRQHRMLVRSPIVQRIYDTNEVLVPAAKLVGLPGIEVDTTLRPVTYHHILCKRHEVLFAEACPAESLYLGPRMLDATGDDPFGLYPDLPVDGLASIPARLLISGKRAATLTERHRRNGKRPLFEPASVTA